MCIGIKLKWHLNWITNRCIQLFSCHCSLKESQMPARMWRGRRRMFRNRMSSWRVNNYYNNWSLQSSATVTVDYSNHSFNLYTAQPGGFRRCFWKGLYSKLKKTSLILLQDVSISISAGQDLESRWIWPLSSVFESMLFLLAL